MGKMKEITMELNLSEEQLKDKEIQKFALAVGYRKQTNDWYQYWNGNGYCELNKKNGTMITTVLTDEDFKPEFPLNCDMEISKKCTNGCAFCYAGCTPKGKHANIKKFIKNKNSFLYSLHEGTELALNGNEPLHPDLELLLNFCKERGIVANLTVHENTLLKHKEQIEGWLNNNLLHGIGISPCGYTKEMIKWCQKHPTAVIHTIAGITTPVNYRTLREKNLKILILGYKDFGRGITYKNDNMANIIKYNIDWLKDIIKDMLKDFKVVSFDNLAIEQLNPKEWLTEKQWKSFYRGDDGHHTLYIDLVNQTFAKNSVQSRDNHKKILNDIRDMLREVNEVKNG